MKRYGMGQNRYGTVVMAEKRLGAYVKIKEARKAIKDAVEKACAEERNRIVSVVASRLKLSRLSSGEVSRGWQLAIDNVNATILAMEDGE